MSIKVYTLPNCQPCRLTKRKLGDMGLEYTELDAREHVDYLDSLGFRASPVVTVVTDDGELLSWSGHCPNLIEELVGDDV